MQWCLPIGGTSLDRESVRVRPQGGLTHHFGECNVCEDNVTKSKTKEIRDEPVAGLCSIDDIGGHAKSDQYGRSVCRLRHRSARPSSRQAFLRQQDSRYWALWSIFPKVDVLPVVPRLTASCSRVGPGTPPLRRPTPRPTSCRGLRLRRSCRASSTTCRSGSEDSPRASPPRPPAGPAA